MRRAARLVLASALLVTPRAFASLPEDAATVDGAAIESRHMVELSRTIFVEEGHVVDVPLTTKQRCKSIVIVAVRNIQFTTLTASAADDADERIAELSAPNSVHRTDSEAGLLQLGGCGPDAAAIDKVYIRMLSPRGTLEIRVLTGDAEVPMLKERLGRSPGPETPRGDPGPLLPVASLADRRQRADAAAKAEGAASTFATETSANETGLGDATIKVVAGCHRVVVMAEPTEGHAVMDVDAELREKDTGAVLSRDRGETPDARLEACVARPTAVSIVFAGAPPRARVMVLDEVFSLPSGIPQHYGDRARAAVAGALRKRTRRGPTQGPIFETLGAQGSMSTTMQVETGRCYLAGLALVRGASRGVRLVAQASAHASSEEVAQGVDAASVAFCAESSRRARIQVDAPGAGLSWILLVWLVGGAP